MQKLKNWLESVQAKIKAGLSFDQAAAQFSEDPESKAKGGELVAYEKGVFGDAFDAAVEGAQSWTSDCSSENRQWLSLD